MERRRFLAAAGSCVSVLVAGCPSTNEHSTSVSPAPSESPVPETTPTTSPTATQTPTPVQTLDIGESYESDEGTITVDAVHLRRSVLALPHPDVTRPVAPADRQFVFLTLLGDEPDAIFPESATFRLLLDEQAYQGRDSVAGSGLTNEVSAANDAIHPSPGSVTVFESSRASVAFDVPLGVSPERVVVEWSGSDRTARWLWDDQLVKALANPPVFRIDSIDFPETFVCGDPFDIAIRVANDGGRQGLFQATLAPTSNDTNQDGRWVVIPVPPHGTATWTGEFQYPPPIGTQECDKSVDVATYELDWGTGTRTMTTDRHR